MMLTLADRLLLLVAYIRGVPTGQYMAGGLEPVGWGICLHPGQSNGYEVVMRCERVCEKVGSVLSSSCKLFSGSQVAVLQRCKVHVRTEVLASREGRWEWIHGTRNALR